MKVEIHANTKKAGQVEGFIDIAHVVIRGHEIRITFHPPRLGGISIETEAGDVCFDSADWISVTFDEDLMKPSARK